MKKLRLDESNIKRLPGNKGNAYSSSRYLYSSIKVTDDNILISSANLEERVSKILDKNEKGGIILFSLRVNATIQSQNKLVKWIKSKVATLNNKITMNKRINTLASKYKDITGWTIGKFLKGVYKVDDGTIYGEDSLSIEIVGITTEQLIAFAEDLCEVFNQESVLVKDYNNSEIYFVNKK